MTDLEQAEVQHNKAIRGYIIRCLVKGYNNTALTRQISNSMMAAGLILSPDISSTQMKKSQHTQHMQRMP